MSKKKIIIILCAFLLLLVILISWIAWGNKAIELNPYTVASIRLPKAFDGFKIAQISDLHNTQIGKDNIRLISLLKKAEPDIIVITGDMIDSRRTDVDVAVNFAAEAVKIAPCYYVTGNHESRLDAYKILRESLISLGVTVLEDKSIELLRDGEKITLIGVNDSTFTSKLLEGDEIEKLIDEKLKMLTSEDDGFTVLLSHRPELFDVYVKNNVDMVFSGHAHGGQIRLPFVGGIYAPNQDFFPEYDGGLYARDNTNMVVSRGIGNSRFPFRVNNRPEITLTELKSK